MAATCLISGFLHDVDVDENCSLLGYYAASNGNFLPTLRDSLSGCPETTVRNYHYSLGNNPEERTYIGSYMFRLDFQAAVNNYMQKNAMQYYLHLG
jgi:hypothetical protein